MTGLPQRDTISRHDPALSSIPSTIEFVDAPEQAGLTRLNVCGGESKSIIVEVNGNGAALIDYDNDGEMDRYLTFREAAVPSRGTSPGCSYADLNAMCGPQGLRTSHRRPS